jgi:phosphate acetyltransferase
MTIGFMQTLRGKAQSTLKRVVFPEANEEKIIQAASKVHKMKIAIPILIGMADEIRELAYQIKVDLTGIKIVDNNKSNLLDFFVKKFSITNPIYPPKVARHMLQNRLNFGAMMVRTGQSDAMVAGLSHSTPEVIMSSQMFIGMKEEINTVSSFFLMAVPKYKGIEGNLIVFADCGVCPDPTPEELADITISTADTINGILNWEPRIAMLSFSTKGSAEHPKVDQIKEAVNIIKKRRPSLLVDGELQADAAIVPEVAEKKVKKSSEVAGRANILIFPDLNSGNIAYKLVQRLAKADAYGPFLQGFSKPVSDLSRGSTVEDIIGATTLVAVRAQTL